MLDFGQGQADSFASLNAGPLLGSTLLTLLMADDIVPGDPPGYELCKTIYAYHPLGPVLAEAPISRAQALPRDIEIARPAEHRLIEQYDRTAKDLGKIGMTTLIHTLAKTSRIYGIASLAVGEKGKSPSEPLEIENLSDADIFFNVLDPLNTAGSLVLNQDPNSPDFLKPRGDVSVQGQRWHPSRLFIKMNEQPLYIEWTTSAYGFVGRSIYQRALYPLKTFIQTMVTDQMVTQKAGLLVAKMESPGSFIDNVMQVMFGWKRSNIKAGVTNQVLSIGVQEDIETLNMQNLEQAASFARTNVLKNIATAAGMPASIIAQETLTEGFGEGSEDAKKEASYLDFVRQDLQPIYDFLDKIVMRRAWTQDFYATIQRDYPDEYGKVPYESALMQWMGAFKAYWPNLLVEPDSEKSKTADVQFKAVIATAEVLVPILDPENIAKMVDWIAENANEREELFAGKLDIDTEALVRYLEEKNDREAEALVAEPGAGEEPPKPRPFSAAS